MKIIEKLKDIFVPIHVIIMKNKNGDYFATTIKVFNLKPFKTRDELAVYLYYKGYKSMNSAYPCRTKENHDKNYCWVNERLQIHVLDCEQDLVILKRFTHFEDIVLWKSVDVLKYV